MRSAKDFFRPKAIGAPMPPREIPFRPARMIHFFDPSNPKMAAVRPWLPDELLDRKKQGFAMPLPEWLGGDPAIAAKMHDTADSPLSDCLDMGRVGALFEANAAGMRNLTGIVFAHFVLDQWFGYWEPT